MYAYGKYADSFLYFGFVELFMYMLPFTVYTHLTLNIYNDT